MENETVDTDVRPEMPPIFSSLFTGNNIFGMDMSSSRNVLKAYLEAQRNMGKVIRNKKNAAFGGASKYADLTSVLEAIDVAVQDAGLVLMQPFQYEEIDGKHVLMLYTCIADTSSGEALVTMMPLPALTDPQKLGSAITYFRRYSLMTMFGLAPEDDDGNAASGVSVKAPARTVAPSRNTVAKPELSPIKAELQAALRAKGAKSVADVKQILEQVGVRKKFDDVTDDEVPDILTRLTKVGDF